MGRVRIPLEQSRGRPSGPRWTEYRKMLTTRWFRGGRTCYYCGHGFAAAHLIEVAHLISPLVRPDLAWSPDNLVPSHGRSAGRGGNRRCSHCDLNCNWIAHNAPDAPKDENGADLPFTPQFMQRAISERAQFRSKQQFRDAKPAIPAVTPARRREPVVPFRQDVGREW